VISDALCSSVKTHKHMSTLSIENANWPRRITLGLALVPVVLRGSRKGLRHQSEALQQGDEDNRERWRPVRAIGSLVGLVIECSGFVRYRRGPWKRKVMKALSVPNKSENASQRQRLALAIRRLADALVAGDDGALAPLQRLSRLHPVAFADEIGRNLTDLAYDALAASAAGANLKCYTDMVVHLKLASATLAGDSPSPIMVCCSSWVAIMQAFASSEAMKAAEGERGAHLVGLISREYMHAAKTLAQIAALETRRTRRVRVRAKTIDARFKIIR
jgi:hypothetical protein